MVAFVLMNTAVAQVAADWQYVAGPVLEPDPGLSYMATSIGSPSVVWDSIRERWFMLFETLTATVDPDCPQGVWGVGAATSEDGVTWTPYSTPILNPVPSGTRFFNCVASHPTGVFLPSGNGQIVVFFKAEQSLDACALNTPTWGCDVKTGFGRAQITLNVSGDPSVIGIGTKPVHTPTATNYGFPKVVKDGNQYRILYQAYPDIVSTSSAVFTSFPAATTEIELINGEKYGTTYAIDEWYNPSFVCDDDPAFPYAVFVGARNTNGATVVEGAWGKATRDVWAGGSFALDLTPQVTWSTNEEWRHYDVTRFSDDTYAVWFSEKDPITGNNFIRFGATTATIDDSLVVTKNCP